MISARSGHRQYMVENGLPCSTPANGVSRVHGLDLPMLRVEFLERSHTNQFPAQPGGPERNVWHPELFKIKGMGAFGRRLRPHRRQMCVQKVSNRSTAQIIDPDFYVHGDVLP